MAGTRNTFRLLMGLWRRLNDGAAQVRLEFVFVAIALPWGVAQAFIVPPFQVPDEGDHWFRAWALTDGQLTADSKGKVTLPGNFDQTVHIYTGLISNTKVLPPSLEGQPGFADYNQLFNGSGSTSPLMVDSRVANYGPVGYLPQAAGIGVGRLLGASSLASFYLARLANLFASVVLVFLAIRLAPFGKQLFVFVALLPMTMFELASVSCDALTISGAIFFTGLILWAAKRETLRGVDIAVVLAAAALMLNIKPGYEALALLVLVLRPAQLGGRARYLSFVAASILVTLGVFAIDYLTTGAGGRAQTAGGANEQLVFVLHEPRAFLGVVWSNLQNNLPIWILQTIGVLGWFTVPLPSTLYVFVVCAGVALFVGMAEAVDLRFLQRTVLAGTATAVFVSLAIVLFVALPTNNGDISLQGRYLIPVLLVFLLSAYGIRFTKVRLGPSLLIGVLLVMMVVNLSTLYTFYNP